jgi:hypothetical protein
MRVVTAVGLKDCPLGLQRGESGLDLPDPVAAGLLGEPAGFER